MSATKELVRENIAQRREREYFNWQRYEAEMTPEVASFEAPYKLALEILGIEPSVIQQRAAELIEAHDRKPTAEWQTEYEANARTAIFEALTASGHLSRIEFEGHPDEVNQAMLERWLNGMQPDLPDHELKRRFQEICEELIIQEVQSRVLSGELPPDVEIATESTYVTGLSNEAAEKIGYRWRNKKGMTRATSFIAHKDGKIKRVVEQISYSNSSAHDSILRRHQEGIAMPRAEAADVDLLGAPLLYSRSDMTEGVVGVQRRIDAFSGESIRFGEQPQETTPTYEQLREVSAVREAQVESFVGRLAGLERTLDAALLAGEITRQEHSRRYMAEVRVIVRAICVLQPEYAEAALGEAVVEDFWRAHARMMVGDDSGAAEIVAAAADREQEITVCGMSIGPEEQAAGDPDGLRALLKDTKENWTWTTGKCRVQNCPTRPNYTKVGPCQVCVGCQGHFDNGNNPADIYASILRRQPREQANSEATQERSQLRKIRFEEITGIGSAELQAFDGELMIATGDEALKLRRQLVREAYELAA